MARSAWGLLQSDPALSLGEALQWNRHLNTSQSGSANTRDGDGEDLSTENEQETFQCVIHFSLLLVQIHLVLVSAVFRPPEGGGLRSARVLKQ